jgi:hypothetical protein
LCLVPCAFVFGLFPLAGSLRVVSKVVSVFDFDCLLFGFFFFASLSVFLVKLFESHVPATCFISRSAK